MEEPKELLLAAAGIIIIVLMIMVGYNILNLMNDTKQSINEQLTTWEEKNNGNSSHGQEIFDDVSVGAPAENASQGMELIISDDATRNLLITVCVVIAGGAIFTALFLYREKIKREQEYTKEILETPLEQFGSMEVNRLKKKYRE